ncbi:MAG: hypothetical protein ABEN55_17400, partial [Bradymonadaceae bacterium]
MSSVICLLFVGCATTGQKGNVRFSYVASDQIEDGVREPLVAGTELDIVLSPVSSSSEDDADPKRDRSFAVRRATSSTPSVLEVVAEP